MSPRDGRDPRDERLRALPSPEPGVRLWAARLVPRAGDADLARLAGADEARRAALPAALAGRLLARRALLRRAVAAVAGCDPRAVQLPGGPGPRRALAPGAAPRWVSASAGGTTALLAVAEHPVGVDLEPLPGPPDALLVAREVLAPAEHAWVAADSAGAPGRFLRVWVRKEAVVKLTGEGLERDLRGFTVDAAADGAVVGLAGLAGLAGLEGAGPGGGGVRTAAVELAGHAAALAVPAGAAPGAGAGPAPRIGA
ncbi:4'-phosphopantetheinyl transferase family protein [Kineococcus gypseus]|uniref:4'-phosphopantetheinyl transferase family protein n=1 Tax=Kineococcus gypseus TaxID=1637102 RepID=UPI003D7F17C2